jgi:hypothetical protein
VTCHLEKAALCNDVGAALASVWVGGAQPVASCVFFSKVIVTL